MYLVNTAYEAIITIVVMARKNLQNKTQSRLFFILTASDCIWANMQNPSQHLCVTMTSHNLQLSLQLKLAMP